MNRLKLTLLGVLLFAGTLHADYYPARDCGPFVVGGQALYWRPSGCNLNVAILDPRPEDIETLFDILPQGNMKAIDPNYAWGARVFVAYVEPCGCQDVRVSYIYLHSSDRATFRPPGEGGIYPVAANPNAMRLVPLYSSMRPGRALAKGNGRVCFDYDSVDLQLASRCRVGRCFSVRNYVGLHFANIDRRFHTDVIGTALTEATISEVFTFTTRDHRETWGVGPLLGGNLAYQFLPCLSIEGHLSGGVIAGDTSGSLFNRWTQTLVDQFGAIIDEFMEPGTVTSKDRTLVVPHLAASLALSYTRIWCCLRLTAEIGWEFRTYVNALDTLRFNDERGTSDSDCDSFRLNGLFFGLRVTL